MSEINAGHALHCKIEEKGIRWDDKLRNFPFGNANVKLDVVYSEYFQGNLTCLNPNAHLILLGFMGQSGPVVKEVNLEHLVVKGLTVSGFVLRSNSEAVKIKLKTEIHEEIWPAILEGKLKLPPIIAQPFKGTGDAIKKLWEKSC